MAGIAQLGTLVSALSNLPGASDSHVWIDPQLGLVMGVYPSPYSRFDFAAEAVELLKPEKAAPKPTISLLGEAKRVVQKYEIETNDAIYVVGSATQLLVQGLDLIERINPGTLERFSKQKKQTKRPVARTRQELYDIPHPESHSTQLKCGYYVATNNKSTEARGFLRFAAELAGLEWGNSFIVRRA